MAATQTSIWSVFISNFFHYDFLIFLLAAGNVFVLFRTNGYARHLFYVLNPQGWMPGGKRAFREMKKRFERQHIQGEQEIILLRRKTTTYYSFYENITAIFPLMGILGTVVSLLPMINQIGELASGYFFSALTSTLWGIIFAIIFKGLNGYLSAVIEDNEKNVIVYLERNTAVLLEKPDEKGEKDEEKSDY